MTYSPEQIYEVAKKLSDKQLQHILEEMQKMVDHNSTSSKWEKFAGGITKESLEEIIAQFPHNKKWTFSDLQDENIFPPDIKIKKQLIDNRLYFMANPTPHHQKIVARVSRIIGISSDEKEIGEVYVAPTAIKIDENNALEPDIILFL